MRSLIIPWFVFFVLSIAGLVSVGIIFRMEPQFHEPSLIAMAVGIVICLFFNIATLSKAGIWIAYSLPLSLRNTSRPWIVRALLVISVAVLFYLVSHASWMPMIWQGAVVPAIFTFALFVALWHVLGPLLRWCSTLPFSRTILFVLSLPLFATVPVTALFLGETIFDAYQASQPNFLMAVRPQPLPPTEIAAGAATTPNATSSTTAESPAEKRALSLKEVAEKGQPCPDESRNIQRALDPSVSEEIAYWAIRALSCAEMKSVVALPKLVKLMQSHPSNKVRTAAISAMPQYGNESVKQVTYLLYRRLSTDEPTEVIEAAASVFARLPEDDRKSAITRLTSLLKDLRTSETAARLLTQKFKRPELVTEFVSENLNVASPAHDQAISMICLLPKEGKVAAEAHLSEIVAAVKTGDENDHAMKALDCMGATGLQAIRQEVVQPTRLDRTIAARALATMDTKNNIEVLGTVADCARDKNDTIRKWCGQSLGQIGAPALPEIIELLKSGDHSLKATGRNALEHFGDLSAKEALKKIRADNSGWLANQRKIQIARAIDTALMKLEQEEQAHSEPETAPSQQ
ncbi:MAG: HEAT repeat domain-containing protein [Bdellovibrionaceae bacterium]|nr:HEAT repeat domain-containing protein [Pseudobdellovibrionaceae bacterium]